MKRAACTVGHVKRLAFAVFAVPTTLVLLQVGIDGWKSFEGTEMVWVLLRLLSVIVLGLLIRRAAERMKQHFERISHRQDNLLSMASHDLKSPVASILMSAEMLESGDPEDKDKMIEIILRQSRSMVKLIDDILLSSSAKDGRIELNIKKVNVGDVCREVLLMLTPLAEAKGVRLICDLGELEARCDPSRLKQIISNLVVNAVKHTPIGGVVAVGQREVDGLLTFVVEDSGNGIASDKLVKIFEPFEKEGTSPGHGLGLHIVKTLIDAHKGNVWARSKLGEGTTFFFTLGV